MRYSRNKKSRATSQYTIIIIVIVLIGSVFYFGAASVMGSWVAQNMVTPLLKKINSMQISLPLATKSNQSKNDSLKTSAPIEKNNTIKATDTLEVNGFDFFTIQMGAFKNQDNADVFSTEIQKKGGAGYIYKDDLYRVLGVAYRNEKDALDVKEQLTIDNIEARIFPLTIKGINMQITADTERINGIKAIFTKWNDIQQQIEKLIISYDKGTSDIKVANEQIITIRNSMEEIKNDLQEFLSGNENNSLYNGLYNLFTNHIKDISTIQDQNITNRIEFSAKIKYTYIKMNYDYYNFINQLTQ